LIFRAVPPVGVNFTVRPIPSCRGGAGFIGSALARRLLEDGHHLRILDRYATGRRSNLHALGDAAEAIEGDVQSHERVT
jgi:nucleoside-diphosphate-sugar epimerase